MALDYDAEEHAFNCRIVGDTADTVSKPGFRVYSNPNHDFDLNLPHTVDLPNNQRVTLSRDSISENIIEYKLSQSSDGSRQRSSGWRSGTGKGWSWLKDVLLSLTQWPQHFQPRWTMATSKGRLKDQGASSSSTSSITDNAAAGDAAAGDAAAGDAAGSAAAAAAAADTDAVVAVGAPEAGGSMVPIVNMGKGAHNPAGIHDKQLRPKRAGRRAKDTGVDTSEWFWWYIVGCQAPGCVARAIIGQRFDSHEQLSVRFLGDCVHRVGGPTFGRVDGARREAVRDLCTGCAPRQVRDRLLLARPPEHKLDGNVSKSGASLAVLRKIRSEASSSLGKAAGGPLTPLEALMRATDMMYMEDEKKLEAYLAEKPGSKAKQQRILGYRQLMYQHADRKYVIGLWTGFHVELYTKLCNSGVQGGLWFDATSKMVSKFSSAYEDIVYHMLGCEH